MAKLRRWVTRIALVLILAVVLAAGGAWWALQRSLPAYAGELVLPGLGATATMQRDALGIVTIEAAGRLDAIRALGFVHAQERYFEMDLTRRSAAGELAELFGPAAIEIDRKHRVHRFRARAQQVLAAADAIERSTIDAYVAGVNAGLTALGARQFPYLLLRQTPRPWSAEDCMLVVYAMFIDLNDQGNAHELARTDLLARAPPSLARLLDAAGTRWDAALAGDVSADPPLPNAAEVDLRLLPRERFGLGAGVGGDIGIGSNNFAVGGALTAHGAALVANDMHLGLRVPNIWFRARLRFASEAGNDRVDVSGITLPGVPGIVIGSNGQIAWAFTNSYGDWLDWVQVQWSNAARTRYRTPEGVATVSEHHESILVAGAASEDMLVRETIWGPVVHEDSAHGALALAWTAHRPQAVNLALSGLETARSVDEAIAIAHRSGMPPQNFLVGDRDGNVAWTIIGAMPARGSADPRVAADWSVEGAGWTGWLRSEQYPMLRNPADHRLWSANARVASAAAQNLIGNGGYALGARAMQIRDGLRAREQLQPADMLAIQLDDRSLFLQPWWQLLRDTLATRPDDAGLRELDRLTASWDPRAVPEAVAYRLVRGFRLAASSKVLDGLAGPLRDAEHADYRLPPLQQSEGIVWKLLQERPAHLLAPIHDSWDALLLAAARDVVDGLAEQPGGLAARSWGERNTTRIRHPLSRAVPGLAWLLDAPPRALPGDSAMPRVQGPAFGASQRMAVSPGHESEGYFHMPGGQSGHPLSPYYLSGHTDWEEGTPTAFLPGPAEHTLVLSPAP